MTEKRKDPEAKVVFVVPDAKKIPTYMESGDDSDLNENVDLNLLNEEVGEMYSEFHVSAPKMQKRIIEDFESRFPRDSQIQIMVGGGFRIATITDFLPVEFTGDEFDDMDKYSENSLVQVVLTYDDGATEKLNDGEFWREFSLGHIALPREVSNDFVDSRVHKDALMVEEQFREIMDGGIEVK